MVQLESPEGRDDVALQLIQFGVERRVAALLQFRDVHAVEFRIGDHIAGLQVRVIDLRVARADADDIEVGVSESAFVHFAVAVRIILRLVVLADVRFIYGICGSCGILGREIPGFVLRQEIADAVTRCAAGNGRRRFAFRYGVFHQDLVEVCDLHRQVCPFAPGPGVSVSLTGTDAGVRLFEVVGNGAFFLRFFDRERTVFIGDRVVTLLCVAFRRNGVGAGIFAFFSGDIVIDCIRAEDAGNRRCEFRIFFPDRLRPVVRRDRGGRFADLHHDGRRRCVVGVTLVRQDAVKDLVSPDFGRRGDGLAPVSRLAHQFILDVAFIRSAGVQQFLCGAVVGQPGFRGRFRGEGGICHVSIVRCDSKRDLQLGITVRNLRQQRRRVFAVVRAGESVRIEVVSLWQDGKDQCIGAAGIPGQGVIILVCLVVGDAVDLHVPAVEHKVAGTVAGDVDQRRVDPDIDQVALCVRLLGACDRQGGDRIGIRRHRHIRQAQSKDQNNR